VRSCLKTKQHNPIRENQHPSCPHERDAENHIKEERIYRTGTRGNSKRTI
jgi:hypothetical protein